MIDGAEFGLSGVLFEAGKPAPAGRYQRIDRAGRDVELCEAGNLPPSFDGRVAVYARLAELVAPGIAK
jgi:hypothetical protein